IERRALGYEVRLLRNLGEKSFVEPGLNEQVDGGADVDYPFDALIDAVAVERQTGVLAGGEQPEDVVQIAVEVDADDFTARHHDVVDRNVLEVEDAEQHTLVAAWNQRTRFIDHGAQLLAAELLNRRLGGREARELQKGIGYAVGEPDHRINDPQQRRESSGGGKCGALRLEY